MAPAGVDHPRSGPLERGSDDDGRRMPESGGGEPEDVTARGGMTWADLVGRDGIEPPTLRFSAARSTD
jgi:hypothetical protein